MPFSSAVAQRQSRLTSVAREPRAAASAASSAAAGLGAAASSSAQAVPATLESASAPTTVGSPSAPTTVGSPSAPTTVGSPSAPTTLGSPSAPTTLGSPSAQTTQDPLVGSPAPSSSDSPSYGLVHAFASGAARGDDDDDDPLVHAHPAATSSTAAAGAAPGTRFAGFVPQASLLRGIQTAKTLIQTQGDAAVAFRTTHGRDDPAIRAIAPHVSLTYQDVADIIEWKRQTARNVVGRRKRARRARAPSAGSGSAAGAGGGSVGRGGDGGADPAGDDRVGDDGESADESAEPAERTADPVDSAGESSSGIAADAWGFSLAVTTLAAATDLSERHGGLVMTPELSNALMKHLQAVGKGMFEVRGLVTQTLARVGDTLAAALGNGLSVNFVGKTEGSPLRNQLLFDLVSAKAVVPDLEDPESAAARGAVRLPLPRFFAKATESIRPDFVRRLLARTFDGPDRSQAALATFDFGAFSIKVHAVERGSDALALLAVAAVWYTRRMAEEPGQVRDVPVPYRAALTTRLQALESTAKNLVADYQRSAGSGEQQQSPGVKMSHVVAALGSPEPVFWCLAAAFFVAYRLGRLAEREAREAETVNENEQPNAEAAARARVSARLKSRRRGGDAFSGLGDNTANGNKTNLLQHYLAVKERFGGAFNQITGSDVRFALSDAVVVDERRAAQGSGGGDEAPPPLTSHDVMMRMTARLRGAQGSVQQG